MLSPELPNPEERRGVFHPPSTRRGEVQSSVVLALSSTRRLTARQQNRGCATHTPPARLRAHLNARNIRNGLGLRNQNFLSAGLKIMQTTSGGPTQDRPPTVGEASKPKEQGKGDIAAWTTRTMQPTAKCNCPATAGVEWPQCLLTSPSTGELPATVCLGSSIGPGSQAGDHSTSSCTLFATNQHRTARQHANKRAQKRRLLWTGPLAEGPPQNAPSLCTLPTAGAERALTASSERITVQLASLPPAPSTARK